MIEEYVKNLNDYVEKLNYLEEQYKAGKIDVSELVNRCYNLGIDRMREHYNSENQTK